MKKIRILGIAPYKGLVTLMKQCALQYPEIELTAFAGSMEQGLAIARRYSEQYDIIISRANTANMISQAVHIPVIDIGIGYYDVLRCIKMAQNTSTKFALLGFQSLTVIAKNLCDLLQIKLDIFSFSPENWKDSDRLLDNMKEQDYKTVICDIISATEQIAPSDTPLMITGEIGTGKDRVACLYYAKSHRCDNPLYVINCALLNDKTWNFMINHYNSPFTDNENTIYISNLDVLSPQRQKQLLSIILDTNLHIRNRLIFSCTQSRDGHLPHAALEYSNTLGCIPLPIKPLREQKNDLVSSASLYIDTLNQNLGRQVVGLSEEAIRLVKDYDYPCNSTQFKRILKKAVLETSTAYISGETIKTILKEESMLFPADHPSHTMPHPHTQDNDTNKPVFALNLDQSLDKISQDIVQHVLTLCDGNQTAAAKRLGISRTTLWRYINR